MTKKWIAGTFNNGNVDMNTPLPVTAVSDSVSMDINGAQKATIKVARDEFPDRGYWRTNFKRIDTLIALVDDAESWDSPNAILFAGYLSAVPATIGETLTMQVSGLREYWALRMVNRTYNGVITNPKTEYLYEAGTWQGVMKKLIEECHSANGIPSNAVKPPFILGNVDGSAGGTGKSYPVYPANQQKYTDIIEDIRDIASNDGNEYQVIPRFEDASCSRIVFDVVIGSDNNPHIRENMEMTINLVDDNDYLNDPSFKILGFSLNQEGDGYFNRLIIQSKAGEDESGADLQTVTTIGGPSVLVDANFNPNIELTESEMNTQKTERIAGGTKEQLTGVLTVSGDQGTWLNRLGMMLNFETKYGISDGFNGQMRFTDIKFSASDNKINIGFLTKQIRYTKLPRTPTQVTGPGGPKPAGGKSNSTPPNGGGTAWNVPTGNGKGLPGDPTHNSGGSGGLNTAPDNWEDPNKLWHESPIMKAGGIFTEQMQASNDGLIKNYDIWGDGFTGNSLVQGPEGLTVIPDKKGQRFYGLDWVAIVTKPQQEKPHYAPLAMGVYKSAKFTAFPTFSAPDYYGAVNATNNYGLEGVGSKFGEITSEMISNKMNSANPIGMDNHVLEYERLASGVLVQEDTTSIAESKFMVVYFHQLQVFTGDKLVYGSTGILVNSTWVQSQAFAFKASIDPVTGDMIGDWSPYSYPFDNADDSTYYATNMQVESYGSRNHMAIMVTPQKYPIKKQYPVGYTATDPEYFKKIKMGKYSVSKICLLHDFEKRSWFSTPAPVPDQYQTTDFSDDKKAENHWNTPFQVRAYNDEFWLVSMKDETRFSGYYWPDNGSHLYLKVAYKANVDPDNGSGPGEWSMLATLPSTMRSTSSSNIGDSTNCLTDFYRIACFKNMVQIPGFNPEGTPEFATWDKPEDYTEGTVLAGKTNTYAARILYNSKNGNPEGSVVDISPVYSTHISTRSYGSWIFGYNWLDFGPYPVNPADQPVNAVNANWQDFGTYILPIWNVGYQGFNSSTMMEIGSHNGKFLELENNFVVSHAATQSHLFTKIQDGYAYYGVPWVWRK